MCAIAMRYVNFRLTTLDTAVVSVTNLDKTHFYHDSFAPVKQRSKSGTTNMLLRYRGKLNEANKNNVQLVQEGGAVNMSFDHG